MFFFYKFFGVGNIFFIFQMSRSVTFSVDNLCAELEI